MRFPPAPALFYELEVNLPSHLDAVLIRFFHKATREVELIFNLNFLSFTRRRRRAKKYNFNVNFAVRREASFCEIEKIKQLKMSLLNVFVAN